jgi:protein-S-isoprenylcysteine O-methyltransferase Ste14
MLPIGVLLIIPWFLMWATNDTTIGWALTPWTLDILVLAIGMTVLVQGLVLLVHCIQMFSKVGEGTLAPWAPTQKLVVVGVYRYMRNPMITGALFALLGEWIILSNYALFLWLLFFFLGNHLYFIKSEEPGLVERFGEEYEEYRRNVPRWIPRRTSWNSR